MLYSSCHVMISSLNCPIKTKLKHTAHYMKAKTRIYCYQQQKMYTVNVSTVTHFVITITSLPIKLCTKLR